MAWSNVKKYVVFKKKKNKFFKKKFNKIFNRIVFSGHYLDNFNRKIFYLNFLKIFLKTKVDLHVSINELFWYYYNSFSAYRSRISNLNDFFNISSSAGVILTSFCSKFLNDNSYYNLFFQTNISVTNFNIKYYFECAHIKNLLMYNLFYFKGKFEAFNMTKQNYWTSFFRILKGNIFNFIFAWYRKYNLAKYIFVILQFFLKKDFNKKFYWVNHRNHNLYDLRLINKYDIFLAYYIQNRFYRRNLMKQALFKWLKVAIRRRLCPNVIKNVYSTNFKSFYKYKIKFSSRKDKVKKKKFSWSFLFFKFFYLIFHKLLMFYKWKNTVISVGNYINADLYVYFYEVWYALLHNFKHLLFKKRRFKLRLIFKLYKPSFGFIFNYNIIGHRDGLSTYQHLDSKNNNLKNNRNNMKLRKKKKLLSNYLKKKSIDSVLKKLYAFNFSQYKKNYWKSIYNLFNLNKFAVKKNFKQILLKLKVEYDLDKWGKKNQNRLKIKFLKIVSLYLKTFYFGLSSNIKSKKAFRWYSMFSCKNFKHICKKHVLLVKLIDKHYLYLNHEKYYFWKYYYLSLNLFFQFLKKKIELLKDALYRYHNLLRVTVRMPIYSFDLKFYNILERGNFVHKTRITSALLYYYNPKGSLWPYLDTDTQAKILQLYYLYRWNVRYNSLVKKVYKKAEKNRKDTSFDWTKYFYKDYDSWLLKMPYDIKRQNPPVFL